MSLEEKDKKRKGQQSNDFPQKKKKKSFQGTLSLKVAHSPSTRSGGPPQVASPSTFLPLDLSHACISQGPSPSDSHLWVRQYGPILEKHPRGSILASRHMSTKTQKKWRMSEGLRQKTKIKETWTYLVDPQNPSPRSELCLDHPKKKTDLLDLNSLEALSLSLWPGCSSDPCPSDHLKTCPSTQAPWSSAGPSSQRARSDPPPR